MLLGEVPFSEYVDVSPPRPLRRGQVYPFVEMAAVPEGGGEIRRIRERAFDGSGSRFQVGDTLFARITPCTENGKLTRVTQLDERGVGFGSTEFIVLSAKPGLADPEFIYQVVSAPAVRRRAVARMIGTLGRQRVPSWFFEEELTIPAYSLAEQRTIGAALRSIDDATRSTLAIIRAAEQARNALLQEWLNKSTPRAR